MIKNTPPMGWNSWNTFAADINEELIIQITDTIIDKGYRDKGYEYIIIDDCWSLKERVNGKLVADPDLFPHGLKYLSDYIHSKGLKFGMYSCAGFLTCAGYPSSYGHEFEDARQFAEWGVDYLKYDFCNFPSSGNARNAYLTMAMALRSSGREILFAACNWGVENPADWMRSHGAHSYRSTGDIFDVEKSYKDIFISQLENVEGNAPGCYNDMDMLITGMHGNGNVGIKGCTDKQYLQHFAMWAFMGSPLIIGADIRSLDPFNEQIYLNEHLISINQDEECRPPFVVSINPENKSCVLAKILSRNRIAIGMFNLYEENAWAQNMSISFDDLGIHSESGIGLELTDAVTGKALGFYQDGFRAVLNKDDCKIMIGELKNAK